jgi:hypothetical protein
MRYLLSIIATLVVASAVAAVSLKETEEVTLLRAGISQGVITGGWEACKARARELANADTRTSGTVVYVCQTERYRIVATYSPGTPPPPTCPPLPAPETRSQTCPAGTTGTWTQTRTYTAAPAPTCSTAGEWLPTSPPAGACTAEPPPPGGSTVRNGQAFTITGSGFGTKTTPDSQGVPRPTPGPVVFDDFESGTGALHNKPAKVGTWGSGEHSSPTYDTTQPLQGTKVARHAFGNGIYNASLYIDRTTSTVYLDFWNRVVRRSTAPLDDVRNRFTRNFKSWRFYGSGDSSVANEFVPCDSPGATGPSWIQGIEWEDRPWGKWEHYRVVYKSGSGGVFSQHRDGRADVNVQSNSSGQLLGIRLGHYWALDGDANCNSNPGADVYTDLVYIDTSLARVYLADATTLATAKHTAIQIPTAWSDGSVTFTANTHGFKVGDTAHVLVIDANNAQKGSKPVTVQ